MVEDETMALRRTGNRFVVFLLFLPVALGQWGWGVTYRQQSICALTGSTVHLSCSYTHPESHRVKDTFWFRPEAGVEPRDLRTDSEYASHNRLTIRNIGEWDSSEYVFRFITNKPGGKYSGRPGSSLSVTGLQVKVNPTEMSVWKQLTCSTTCRLPNNPTYIWYKNGEYLTEDTSQYNHRVDTGEGSPDRYSCAVKGHELVSPAVYKPEKTKISVSPSGEIVEGSSVTLTCSSDANPPVVNYSILFKKHTHFLSVNLTPWWSISSIRSSESGEYHCRVHNVMGTGSSETITINVKYPPRTPLVSVSPSGEIVEGSSVTLTCSSDANPPVVNYSWYKHHVPSPKASGQVYSMTSSRIEDSGQYYCEAHNTVGVTNSSLLLLDIKGNFKLTIVVYVGAIALPLAATALSVFLWFRTRRAPKSREPEEHEQMAGPGPDNGSVFGMAVTSITSAQGPIREQQEDIHYASVNFNPSRNQEVPFYSIVQSNQPGNQEAVLYSTVQQHQPQNDEMPLYSTVQSHQPKNQEGVLYSTVQSHQPQKQNKEY